MSETIKGKCWCCGDGMTVYQIIPEKRWTMDRVDAEAMGDWVFETEMPGAFGIPGTFKAQDYRIVVAGRDFGCGSKSVEHPMAALKGAGVRIILAESFSRYSFRNAINLGLPAVAVPGITEEIHTGDEIEVDTETGVLINRSTGKQIRIPALSPFAREILSAGGSVAYTLRTLQNNSTEQ